MVELAKPENNQTPGGTPGLVIIQLAFKGKFLPVRKEAQEREGKETVADYLFELFNDIDIAAMTFEQLVKERLYAARDFSEQGVREMIERSGTRTSVGSHERTKRARVVILPHQEEFGGTEELLYDSAVEGLIQNRSIEEVVAVWSETHGELIEGDFLDLECRVLLENDEPQLEESVEELQLSGKQLSEVDNLDELSESFERQRYFEDIMRQ